MSGAALFDSHLHLTDGRLAGDLEAVLVAARDTGVREMVTVGTSPDDAEAACELASAIENVWATAGLHPHEAREFGPDVRARLEALAGRREVVAIGETGLDYHYDNSPRAAQRWAFEAQVALAESADLPVVVHSRDADEDTAAVIRTAGSGVRGVLHCFTGGDGLLDAALEAGWYVSFSGIATFGSWDGAGRVARVPSDRLLIETDSPYLAPVPERGHRNEPAFLVHTCRAVAEQRDGEPDEVAASTRAAARRFYGLEAAGG